MAMAQNAELYFWKKKKLREMIDKSGALSTKMHVDIHTKQAHIRTFSNKHSHAQTTKLHIYPYEDAHKPAQSIVTQSSILLRYASFSL